MISIDCAFDEGLAKELKEFFDGRNIKSKIEESVIVVEEKTFQNQLLEVFLELTKRDKFKVKNTGPDSFLISKEVKVEEFGLGTCEICGYVAFDEELFSHRRTHGI